MSKVSLLNTTIGIIGNQNTNVARLIYEAHRIGIKIGVYVSTDNPAIKDADFKIVGKPTDKDLLKKFAEKCQAVIYVDGSGISKGLVSYLSEFTDVPQGSNALDLINDRAILRVFLDACHIKSLPYRTVFSLADVKQSCKSTNDPLYLRPVQTSYREQKSVLITNSSQLDRLSDLFNGGAYLLEALPSQARYFKLTFIKSKTGVVTLPAIEEHYEGQRLYAANVNPQLTPEVSDKFSQIILNLANQLMNYAGGLTISLILTPDDQVCVDGIELPLGLVNNIFNLTPDNLYQMILRSILGLPVQTKSLHDTWLLRPVDQSNLAQVQKLWATNGPVDFDLSSLIRNNNRGYALISADTLDNVKKHLQKDQL